MVGAHPRSPGGSDSVAHICRAIIRIDGQLSTASSLDGFRLKVGLSSSRQSNAISALGSIWFRREGEGQTIVWKWARVRL